MKFDTESAKLELKRFTDALKISDLKLAKLEKEQESVLELIEYGYLTVMDSGNLEYKLMFPPEGDEGMIVDKVKFKLNRLTVNDIEKRINGKNDMENARKMLAMITDGINSGIFSKLDADDFTNCSNIAAFFLPR